MTGDCLAREAALEARRRVLGAADPRCAVPGCDETDPRALIGAYPRVLCAEHQADAEGDAWLEGHHVAGRHNDPTEVWLPANWHAIMTSEQQTAWPRELLRNPDGDPLLRTIARVRGSRETIGTILERALAPIEREDADLHDYLDERLGPGWVAGFAAWRVAREDAR